MKKYKNKNIIRYQGTIQISYQLYAQFPLDCIFDICDVWANNVPKYWWNKSVICLERGNVYIWVKIIDPSVQLKTNFCPGYGQLYFGISQFVVTIQWLRISLVTAIMICRDFLILTYFFSPLSFSFLTAGAKAFLCDHCGAQFSKEDALESHRQTHTGKSPLWFLWR